MLSNTDLDVEDLQEALDQERREHQKLRGTAMALLEVLDRNENRFWWMRERIEALRSAVHR